MKKYKSFKIFMLYTIIVMVSNEIKGQERFDVPDLFGIWTFDSNASFARMHPDIKNYLDKNPNIKTEFMLAYEGRTLTIFDNGKMVQTMANGLSINTYWRTESNILFIGNEPNNITEHKILDLKHNRLVIQMKSLGEAKPFLSELHFTKK